MAGLFILLQFFASIIAIAIAIETVMATSASASACASCHLLLVTHIV